MSAESLSEQDRELARKLTSAPIFFDPNLERWVIDRVMLNIGNMPIGQLQGGRGLARVLKQDTSTQSLTAATGADTSFFTYPLKGGMLAQHGELHFKMLFKARTPDASNTLRIRLKLGGSEVNTLDVGTSVMDTTERHGLLEFKFINLGARNSNHTIGRYVYDFEPNSQEGDVAYNSISSVMAIDTSVDKEVDIGVRWISAGDMSFTKLYASLQIFNPVGLE